MKTKLLACLPVLSLILWSGSLDAQSYCSSGSTSGYNPNGQFAMGISGFSLQGEQYSIIGIPVSSGSGLGVQDFTGSDSASLAKGKTYSVSINTNYYGSAYPNYPAHTIAMWIDFNNDGDFTDSGEEITNTSVSYPSPAANTTNFSFTIPTSSSLGRTRLRVSAKSYSSTGASTAGPAPSLWPCGTFGYGTTMDFTVNIVQQPPSCNTRSTPYKTGFEGYIGNNIYPHLPNCWDTLSTNTANGYWPPATNKYDSLNARKGYNSIYLIGSASDNGFHGVVSPKIQDLHVNKQVYLFCKGSNACSLNNDHLIVGTIDSSLITSSIQYIDTIYPTNNYQDYLVELNGLDSTAHRLVLIAPLTGNFCNRIYIDNVAIESQSNCPSPQNVQISVTSDSTASVKWDNQALDNGAIISWVRSDSMNNAITDTTLNDSVVLSGLDAGKVYDFYIKMNCSDLLGTYSTSRGPYSFETPCEPINSPWYDDLQSTSSFVPECWGYSSNGGSSYSGIGASSIISFNIGNGLDTTAITSPWISNLSDADQIFTFYAKTTNTNSLGKFEVITTDITGSYKTANMVDDYTLFGSTAYQKFTIYLDSTNTTDLDKRIGFRFHSTSNSEYIYIDSVYLKPTCPDRAPIPIMTISDTTFCIGDSVTLTAPNSSYFNYSNENDSFKSYSWSNGVTTQSNTIYQTDTIVLEVETQRGCVLLSNPIQINVNPRPISSITFIDSTACFGDSIKLNVSGSSGNYQWSNSVTDSSLYIYQLGSSTLNYVVTDLNGCTDTSENVTIEIFSTPSSTITTSTINACVGDTLTVSSQNVGNVDYLWNNGDTTISIFLSQSSNVTLTASNNYGCSSSDSSNITFHNLPLSQIIVNGDSVACDGEVISLFGPSGGYNYLWSNGQTNSSIQLTNNDTISLTVSDIYGCIGFPVNQIVVFNDAPDITLGISGPAKVCAGDSVRIIPTYKNNVDSISWHSLNGSQLQQQGDTLIVIQSDQYYAIAHTYLGCSDTSNSIDVSIEQISLGFSSVNAMCSNSSNGSINTIISGGYLPYSYSWSNGGNNSSVSNLSPGLYQLSVSDSLGCSASSSFVLGYNFLTENPSILGASTGLCLGQFDTLYVNGNFNSFIWSGDASGTNDTLVVLSGTYKVSTVDTNGCLSSDSLSIDSDEPYTLNPEVCLVTNDTSSLGLNVIIWERSSKIGVELYNVYRSSVIGYQKIGSRGVNQLSQLTDYTANASSQSYDYYITLTDSCGIEHGNNQNEHSTILLQSSIGTSNEVNLSWNSYSGASILYYVIYRQNALSNQFMAIDSVNTSTTNYIDYGAASGLTKYFITAVLSSTCTSSAKTSSRTLSNVSEEQTISLPKNYLTHIELYPNPANRTIEVSSDDVISCTAVNTLGQSFMIDIKERKGDVSSLKSGQYLFMLTTKSEEILVKKVEIVH